MRYSFPFARQPFILQIFDKIVNNFAKNIVVAGLTSQPDFALWYLTTDFPTLGSEKKTKNDLPAADLANTPEKHPHGPLEFGDFQVFAYGFGQ